MPQRPYLLLYMDCVSPFAFMAFHIVKNSPVFKGCDVEIVPIFLGGLMQKCGNATPISIKNKGDYIGLERKRWTKLFNLPVAEKNPEPFPQLTLNPMRALAAVHRDAPEKLDVCLAALFKALWTELKPISKDEVWQGVLVDTLGKEEAEKFVKLSKTPEVKKLLMDNTDLAFKDGGFGLPFFVATDANGNKDIFWGISHLGMVVRHLGLDHTLDKGFKSML